MKEIILIASLYSISNGAWSAIESIAHNESVVSCVNKYGGNNDECFGEIHKKSESMLTEVYNNKLKEMAAFYFTRWCQEAYKQNQQDWIKYRDNYCELISVTEQGTHSLSEIMLSCMVNMNALRINHIEMIKP